MPEICRLMPHIFMNCIMKTNKLIIKFHIPQSIGRYIRRMVHSTSNPRSKQFVWKDIDWKSIQIQLNNLRNKIFAAKKKCEEPCALKDASTVLEGA